MSFNVQGKIALVTGANRGIGKNIVETLLDHGVAKVYAGVRDPKTIADFASASMGRVVPITMDLTKPDQVQKAAELARDVQLVINNAGVLKALSPLDPASLEAIQFEMEVNVFGLLRVVQAFAPILAANGGGAFAQINSVVSVKSYPEFATYAASKAASYSLTQSLRTLLRSQGTQVVSLHPGPIATDMGDAAGLAAIAEPPRVVSEALIAALQTGSFHVFPDKIARQLWQGYQAYAKAFIETDLEEI